MSPSFLSPKHNGKRVLVFDFDGVLADSFDCFYLLNRDSMKKIDLPLTPKQYRGLFLDNVHQGFQDFIDDKQKFLIFSKFRKNNYDKYYYGKDGKVKLFPGTVKFLKKIGREHILTIASSGKRENVKNLLNKNGVANLFDLILTNSKTSKEGIIKKILGKFEAKAGEATMITDTVGDIRIAKKLGLKTMAVTWGFHSAKLLKHSKPDWVADSLKILYKQLKAF